MKFNGSKLNVKKRKKPNQKQTENRKLVSMHFILRNSEVHLKKVNLQIETSVYHLQGKTESSGSKIKWFASFQLERFVNYGPLVWAIHFCTLFSLWSELRPFWTFPFLCKAKFCHDMIPTRWFVYFFLPWTKTDRNLIYYFLQDQYTACGYKLLKLHRSGSYWKQYTINENRAVTRPLP